jgi:predicted acylesterase/phospholipase RssA
MGAPATSSPDVPENTPITFDRVLQREVTRIEESRKRRKVHYEADKDTLIGLAFSGGGIRSATFNLGILQALAQKKLLHTFDYLSTVSGGGYIGSWLAALTHRATAKMKEPAFDVVEKILTPCKYEPNHRSEPPVVHWLRLYSNYLTPHTGAISGDTWAMLGTWLRNVIVNQAILVLAFVSILVFCQSALLPLVLAENGDNGLRFLIAGGVVLFFGCIFMAINVVADSSLPGIPKTRWERVKAWYRRIQVTATVMVPFVVACVLLNCGLWERLDFAHESVGRWALAGAGFYFAVWAVVALITLSKRKRMISIFGLLVSSLVAGAAGASLLRAYILTLEHLPGNWVWTSANWVVVVLGSAIVMSIVLLTGILHLGLVGRGSTDLVREWWARLGGYLMLITIGWLLLAGVTAFAPLGVRLALLKLKEWSIAPALLWVLHNYLGIKAASSAATSGKKSDEPGAQKKGETKADDGKKGSWMTELLQSPRVLNVIARVAPYVFIVGLVLLVSTAVQIATGLVFNPGDTKELWWWSTTEQNWKVISENYWRVLESASYLWLAGLGGIFFLAALGLSWRVDVNDFSLHHFYRNRLVRCYLGASNDKRKPEPFTGFDESDDFSLCSLDEKYPGPYPILNAALNITGGEELGYATRRAKSFAFTPLYCGYEMGTSGEGPQRFRCDHPCEPSYSRTERGRSVGGVAKFAPEEGIFLGTAMAISGAAASPNMGYYTNPATAFFMALFDVRLGWWMGNSRDPRKWQSTGPALGLGYLLSEVFAQSDQQKAYVYLSDGGHFENLAVYELIRRRCRVIVACDADADGSYQFDNLLSLIEKARTDFGARIEIPYALARPVDKDSRLSKQNFVTGTIYYDPHDPTDTGTLILIKAGMPAERGATPSMPDTRNLPDDVWRYFDQNVTFPHESTSDQWFDEWQFESYRALGEYIGCSAAKDIKDAINAILKRGKPRAVSIPEHSDDLEQVIV